MFRSICVTLGLLGAALLVQGAVPEPARADIAFPVDIRGVIYSDTAPPVRVSCSAKEGNSVIFTNADVSVDTRPAFTFDPTCELHSAMGLFTDGERWNGEVIDEEEVVDTVTDRRGGESFQSAMLIERMGSGSGMIEIVLQYMARFPIDRATATLQPPMRDARGHMMMMNDSTDEIFVGTWRTGKLK